MIDVFFFLSEQQELYMSGCRINHLPDNTFEGLGRLRKLDITVNHLFDLSKDVLNPIPYLHELLLGKYVFYIYNCI